MIQLAVEKRTDTSAPAPELRRANMLPGVVYGAHHEATPIVFSKSTFSKVLSQAGEATIVTLTGLGEPLPTLIHEVDLDPMTNLPRHVDFYAVTKGEKVQVHIPVIFIGESPAVDRGANLVKVLHEVEVEADPMNLPHDFPIDLSVLVDINAQIHVSDIKLPPGVTLVTDGNEVIALTQEVAQERSDDAGAADISTVEVEKKGKDEAEEDTATAA